MPKTETAVFYNLISKVTHHYLAICYWSTGQLWHSVGGDSTGCENQQLGSLETIWAAAYHSNNTAQYIMPAILKSG